MRHVSRTHRVALDWLFDRTNVDPKIQIKYVDTKETSHVMSGTISLFVECLEFLDVFLQPFSFKQKAESHLQESSGKYFKRKFGSGETETNEFGAEEPPVCEFHPATGN